MPTRQAYPTGWQGGGVYAGDNYDELRKYQITLHRQGEGIFSPDRDELRFGDLDANRRLIQSIMGDIAIGDAFNIIGSSATNDFTIRGGDGTADGAFHFYLRGYHVIIETTTTYLTQNTDLNASLIPIPTALTTPSGSDRTDEVYLDIFLKRITGVEDPPLVPDGEAQSKTDRLRLISQVLVAEGTTTPADFIDGDNIEHFTIKLATLERFDGQDAINAGDLTDVRLQIRASALGGEQAGIGVPAFNPSAIKILSQETPDDTVRVAAEGLIISTTGFRVVDVPAQSTAVFAPASVATNTRLYIVEVDDSGVLDITNFSDVVTATLDLFADAPDIAVDRMGLAIVRVDGTGPVTITQDDIQDIRHWLNKGGGGASIIAAPVDRFTVLFGAPQSIFNLSFSSGSEDDLIAVRNGQVLFSEGNAPSDDYFLSTPTQVTIVNPSIPGTTAEETLIFIPRQSLVDFLVVTQGADEFVMGDGTKGPYVLNIPNWQPGDAMVFVGGVIQDKDSYTKTGVSEITFGPTGITPTVLDRVRVIVRTKISATGAALEDLGVVIPGEGPFFKAPNGTQRKLTLTDNDELALDGVPIALEAISRVVSKIAVAVTTTTVTLAAGATVKGVLSGKVVTFATLKSAILTIIGVGGLDQGSEAANTWYAVVALIDTSGVNDPELMLVSAANYDGSIVLPVTHDDYRRVMWARNNGSSNLIVGDFDLDRFIFDDLQNIVTGATNTTFMAADCSSFVPPTSRHGLLYGHTQTGGSSGALDWRVTGSGAAIGHAWASFNSEATGYGGELPLNSVQQIDFKGQGATSIDIDVDGWVEKWEEDS